MKKILLALAITTFSLGVNAQHNHRHHHHWVGPAIIGGILGYALANNHAVANQPSSTFYYQQNHFVYTCPPGFRPIYSRAWAVDRWGRSILVDNFIGCH